MKIEHFISTTVGMGWKALFIFTCNDEKKSAVLPEKWLYVGKTETDSFSLPQRAVY